MTKPTILFWDGEKVIEYFGETHADSIRGTNYLNHTAVDLTHTGTTGRYGYYGHQGWEHLPLNEFPPEFRANLLLLGII